MNVCVRSCVCMCVCVYVGGLVCVNEYVRVGLHKLPSHYLHLFTHQVTVYMKSFCDIPFIKMQSD